MRCSILFLCLTSTPTLAQVARKDLPVKVDGTPFTVFHYGADANKPFLSPLRSVSGKVITRAFPMENIPGESHDHMHHRGLWFSYDDVDGVKFWENDPSYTKPNMGKIVVNHAEAKEGKGSTTVTANMDWRSPNDKVMLTEDREMVFHATPNLRYIDFVITLTAPDADITLGDTKEGAFAIRLSDAFTERKGVKIVDADGRTRMVNVWGKRSNWVDYSAGVDGEKIGVAMFDNPHNLYYPTYWHARDYGLFALNPFGQNAFDPKLPVRHTVIHRGENLVLRYRVVIHPGDAESAHIADLYKEYASKP